MTYQQQERGGGSDYERYLQGMDASMQQKVALTAAYLLGRGTLADMGMGSGTGSEALAALYPNMQVTGVDINPEMVRLASEKYSLPNLDFRTGDIAGSPFPDESLDVVFNSSVLHHVTTFNDYNHAMAETAISNQVRQLRRDGNLIIRDFLRPESTKVWLELPSETVPLFQRFSVEFRKLKPEQERGFVYRELESGQPGWQRFELDIVHAVEFVLRKDYIADWETEVLEEYTYFTQSQFEELLSSKQLRILASTPIRNPWIVSNRFEGRFRLLSLEGETLEYPATNYLIVGEKVGPDEDVGFGVEPGGEPVGYLEFAHYRDKRSGAIRDLIRRPNATLDVVPYFVRGPEVYVVARKSYPRPLLGLCRDRLDGAMSPTYVTEPIVVAQVDKPIAQTVEEALEERCGLPPEAIKRFGFGSISYPSPGGLQEEVRPVFVEVEPFLTGGRSEEVRAVSARQLLRAAQVGGLPDARLEMHIFELLGLLGQDFGSWIGESLDLEVQTAPKSVYKNLPMSAPRRVFARTEDRAHFLTLGVGKFQALTSDGRSLSSETLEFCSPTALSLHTIALLPLWRTESEVYVGLSDEDFPASQCFDGHSNLWVAPAWRLPKGTKNLTEAKRFVSSALLREFGLAGRSFFHLGGAYYPSAGATPEVVYPMACEVRTEVAEKASLCWVSVRGLTEGFADLRDGHLKILLSRAIRALSLDADESGEV